MTTDKDKEKEQNQDPYAGLKALMFQQKPETREAEIRAQKGRARATAWLQAFTTLADAFTLGKGGDVVKRDMNPYILNNMQRADALGEQDRADKKAWGNSLLNLENNIAQYNARQIEIDRQRKWSVEDRENQQKFQREMSKEEFKQRKELMDRENVFRTQVAEQEYDRKFQFAGYASDLDESKAKKQHERDKEKIILQGSIANNKMETKRQYDLKIAELRLKGRETIERLKANNGNYMSIVNPYNDAEMIGIDKSEMQLIFGLALQAKRDDDEIGAIIKNKEGAYTEDEMRVYVATISQMYPEKLSAYLGALAPRILGTQGTTGAMPTGDDFVGPPAPDENRQKSNAANISNKFK